MDYLFSMGHTKIAYICGDSNSVTRQRLAAYYRSMEEHGITVPDEYVRPALYRDLTKAYELTEELLKLKDPPTCILYPDDVACFGGINAIRANGLAIPEDISVVGYDGQRISQVIEPRLTTYKQNTEDLGRLAARKLVEAIEEPKTSLTERLVVQGELIQGRSVKRL